MRRRDRSTLLGSLFVLTIGLAVVAAVQDGPIIRSADWSVDRLVHRTPSVSPNGQDLARLGIEERFLRAMPVADWPDMSGEWGSRIHEDYPHRLPGAALGDYTGLPLNDAGRLKARSWDASILSLPQHQDLPHAATYSLRGPGPNFRTEKVIDPVTQLLIAYTLQGTFGRGDRIIWLDGRPHPPEYAEHFHTGFSTGEVERLNVLKVTTTHLKNGWVNRNGTATSYKATMREHFIRHGDLLTVLTIVIDPVYLEEPMARTSSWVLTPNLGVDVRYAFESVEEVFGHPRGYVPTYPLGTIHDEFAKKYGIPFEATQGGKETLYPEYVDKLQEMLKDAKASGSR